MTVSDHVNGKIVAKTVLTSDIECALAEKLVKLADLGFSLTRRLVMAKAKELCDELKLPKPIQGHYREVLVQGLHEALQKHFDP